MSGPVAVRASGRVRHGTPDKALENSTIPQWKPASIARVQHRRIQRPARESDASQSNGARGKPLLEVPHNTARPRLTCGNQPPDQVLLSNRKAPRAQPAWGSPGARGATSTLLTGRSSCRVTRGRGHSLFRFRLPAPLLGRIRTLPEARSSGPAPVSRSSSLATATHSARSSRYLLPASNNPSTPVTVCPEPSVRRAWATRRVCLRLARRARSIATPPR